MKITFFIGSVSGGGAERVICELASALSEWGHETEILTVTKTDKTYRIDEKVSLYSLDDGIRFHLAPLRVVLKMVRLLHFLDKHKTDVYIVFLPETIRAIMAFRSLIKIPIIISERSNPSIYSKKVQKQMISAFAKADGTVFQTADAMSFYLDRCATLKNPIVIPNAIAEDFIPYEGKDREKIIVAAGRFIPIKNYHLLIKAFSRIADDFPEYTLKIFGTGSMKDDYIALVKQLKIEDRVEFPGYIKNLGEKIKQASLFVMSSDAEGMPNSLMEAMALGIPCISTDCRGGGARFLIENGVNGLLVPVNDIDAMENAIRRVLSNPDDAAILSFNGRKNCEQFHPDKIYRLWEDYIKKLATSDQNDN